MSLFLNLQLVTAGRHGGRHRELARRVPGDVQLHRRAFEGVRMTYYEAGM